MSSSDLMYARFLGAQTIAREVGWYAIEARQGSTAIGRAPSRSGDITTRVDEKAERLARRRLQEAFGDHVILGGNIETASLTWVIDPIDGTANFGRGLRDRCVSPALLVDGATQFSFIYAPEEGKLYSVFRGGGASWQRVLDED